MPVNRNDTIRTNWLVFGQIQKVAITSNVIVMKPEIVTSFDLAE